MKKALSVLLVVGLLTAAMTGFASAADDETNAPLPLPYYLSTTGTVVSVEKDTDKEGALRVTIEDQDGNPAILIVNDRTVYPFENELKAGDVVTGYYLANAPMILIWPAQYNIAVLVAGTPDDLSVKVDRFYTWEGRDDGYLLSQSGQFAFKVDDKTDIILANGDDFTDGYYIGRRIVAIYGASTKSIPELTTATKLIVLYEDAVTLPETVPEIPEDFDIDATGWPIIVNGEKIDAPAVIQTEDGTVMIPLRAVAQKLGYDVAWDGAVQSVRLGVAIHLWIGNEEVHVGRMAPISLSTAPQLINGFTYVPMSFFRDVLNMASAFALEGQIEINSDGGIME